MTKHSNCIKGQQGSGSAEVGALLLVFTINSKILTKIKYLKSDLVLHIAFLKKSSFD